MDKFLFEKSGIKNYFTHLESGNKITGIRAILANMLICEKGDYLEDSNILKTIYNISEIDRHRNSNYFTKRSVDVHIYYVKKFFNEYGYDIVRIRTKGFKLIKK